MNTAALFLLFVTVTVQRSDTQALNILRLSTDRPDKVYVKGESITFTCESDIPRSSSGFSLYCGSYPLEVTPEANSSTTKSVTFLLTGMLVRTDGYMCYYADVKVQSATLWITVVDRPEKPKLSADRDDKTYVTDEAALFTCRTWYPYSDCSVDLYRFGQHVPTESKKCTSSSYDVTFTITFNSAGSEAYYCVHARTVSGRVVSSAPSETVWITVVDPPGKPRLSPDREDKIYLRDEEVILTCETFHSSSVRSVSLSTVRHLVQRKRSEDISSPYSVVFTISDTSHGSENYFCTYTLNRSGREVISQPSERVKITIVDAEITPKISFDKATGVYLKGERVTLICTVTGVNSYRIKFYKDNRWLYQNQITTTGNTGTFTVTEISQEGEYQCDYRAWVKSRDVTSKRSDSVTLTIADLPRPSITVDSNEVRQGEHVTFNCTSPRQRANSTFYLYRHWGSNYSVVQFATAQTNSVTFTIRATYGYNSGNYTCGYEATEGGRQLKSAQSDSVHLSITANSGLAWIIPLAVLTLVILSTLLVVYIWKKGKIRSRGEMRVNLPPEVQTHDNVVSVTEKIRSRGEMRVDPPPEVQTHGNVVYADLKMKPLPKKRKGRQETSQMNDPNDTVYAAVKT